ncbi:metallophosphoesterase [Methylobacter sp. BlB1]|uniref:metallophosphoesterase n=1 Tax=Methylobacter sp. BlB1 TaxID=2785914 RepID=UPI001893182F|nr:metallophosphoesterase [Methylobacter sp. BlB1]MBF6650421.1 metallophosphoesterase [Methylobacter sp. BlB1]
MKIFVASDLHTELVSRKFDPAFDYDYMRFNYPNDADVIVLAGDIGEWTNGIEWARYRFKQQEIVYIAGNHELYDSDLAIIDELRFKAKELNIHFLENESVIIRGVRFLGCTMWTDFDCYSSEEINRAWSTINDYKYIYCRAWWANAQNREAALQLMRPDSLFGFDPEYFSPTVAYLLHKKSLCWLQQQLDQPHTGQTVVVTHHAPTLRSTANVAYGSNLEKFLKKNAGKITLWCHGHIHKSVDYEVAGVRIACNARGYPTPIGLSSSFNEKKLICL